MNLLTPVLQELGGHTAGSAATNTVQSSGTPCEVRKYLRCQWWWWCHYIIELLVHIAAVPSALHASSHLMFTVISWGRYCYHYFTDETLTHTEGGQLPQGYQLVCGRGKICTQACWVLEPALRTSVPDLPSKKPVLMSVDLSPNLLHCLRVKCPWASSLTFLSFTVLNCKMETASPACSLIVGNQSRSSASSQEVLPLTLEFLPQC